MFNLIKFYFHLISRAFYKRIKNCIAFQSSWKILFLKEESGERHIKAILKRIALLIRKFKCDLIFIDVDAYLGEYVQELASMSKYICAIEAHPNNYIKLCNNIRDLGHVIPLNYAIYDFNGSSFLYVREETTHSLVRRKKAKGVIRVKCVTLTSLLRLLYKALSIKTPLAVIIKIDIEGAELNALLGLTVQFPMPLLIILIVELHGSFNKIFVPLIAALKGFKVKLINDSHILLTKVT